MKNDFKYEKLTPMLKHYVQIKNDFKDAILLYRVGDFYEAFFDDAILTTKNLGLTLTGKECGHDKKAPMCGVPHHVIDQYVNKLVKKGYKVALCDQVEDPKLSKGLVKRAITRVITPGTITDMESLDNKSNNYLVSIYEDTYGLSISYCDISTGDLVTFELRGSLDLISKSSIDQIEKLDPKEILLNSSFSNKKILNYLKSNNKFINHLTDRSNIDENIRFLKPYFEDKQLKKISKMSLSIASVSNLIEYIYRYYHDNLSHINEIEVLEIKNYMKLDYNTRKNLELFENLNNNLSENSLLSILDKADTVMGSRLIKKMLERPLVEKNKIEKRLDIVEVLVNDSDLRNNISSYLDDIYDLERLIGKISFKRANARDFISLKNSLRNIPDLKNLLIKSKYENIYNIGINIPNIITLYELLDKSIKENPPLTISEGDIIKQGYSKNLDELKIASESAKADLIKYENEQKELTDIKNLKISYNKNNGYSIEVTKSNLDKIPSTYVRKQTLKNQERFTTETLEKISDLILTGKDKINELEYNIFLEIREEILSHTVKLKALAKMIANIDFLNTMARVARNNNYVRPNITENNIIEIIDGRHPVIEKNLKENEFIPNDTNIGACDNLIQIITGPNMAGKSTYMRQMAILIILAQMGSFVPAKSATVSICDQVFTRIGASDNISKGESTFMLEMNEVSNILKNCTQNSFVILDEVGRGTSSDDGLSIAMALVEYLSKKVKVKTVFATHFHELSILENELDNVKNLKIDILEENNNLVFLRKIKRGSSNRSYGIEVAKLSGLPSDLIDNANLIMDKLTSKNIFEIDKELEIKDSIKNINNQNLENLKKEINSIDINNITPIEAINELNTLIGKVNKL